MSVFKKILAFFFPIEFFKVQTKNCAKKIVRQIRIYPGDPQRLYDSHVTPNGFTFWRRAMSFESGIRTQNSFAPVAVAKMEEREGITDVSIYVRMNLFVWALMLFLHAVFFLFFLLGTVFSVLDIVALCLGIESLSGGSIVVALLPYCFLWILDFFAFRRPAKKLMEHLTWRISYGEDEEG